MRRCVLAFKPDKPELPNEHAIDEHAIHQRMGYIEASEHPDHLVFSFDSLYLHPHLVLALGHSTIIFLFVF